MRRLISLGIPSSTNQFSRNPRHQKIRQTFNLLGGQRAIRRNLLPLEETPSQQQAQASQQQNQNWTGDQTQQETQAPSTTTDTTTTPDYTTGDTTGSTTTDSSAPSGSDYTGDVPQSNASSSDSLRQSVVNYALQFVGNPYVYGGTSLTNGTDCSGFTQSVLANFGISISRTAASQSGGGTAVDMSNLQPGDLLFYDNGIGNGQVVHASNEQTGIIVSSVDYRTACAARSYF